MSAESISESEKKFCGSESEIKVLGSTTLASTVNQYRYQHAIVDYRYRFSMCKSWHTSQFVRLPVPIQPGGCQVQIYLNSRIVQNLSKVAKKLLLAPK
jgi:hypothetical protein